MKSIVYGDETEVGYLKIYVRDLYNIYRVKAEALDLGSSFDESLFVFQLVFITWRKGSSFCEPYYATPPHPSSLTTSCFITSCHMSEDCCVE